MRRKHTIYLYHFLCSSVLLLSSIIYITSLSFVLFLISSHFVRVVYFSVLFACPSGQRLWFGFFGFFLLVWFLRSDFLLLYNFFSPLLISSLISSPQYRNILSSVRHLEARRQSRAVVCLLSIIHNSGVE